MATPSGVQKQTTSAGTSAISSRDLSVISRSGSTRGKDLAEALPAVLFRRGENDLDAGMTRRQPVQFHARVSRRADDAQFDHVLSLFSFMIRLTRLSVFLAWAVDLVTRRIVFSPATLPTISGHSAWSIASHTPDA